MTSTGDHQVVFECCKVEEPLTGDAVEGADLREGLPDETQEVLRRHEAERTTESAEYSEAMEAFYRRHVCRMDPWPVGLEVTLAAIDADPTVYHTMNGPSEFHVLGSLRAWSIVDRLPAIDVPTLVISGRYDEATPETVRPIAEQIRDSKWVVFEESSHMPHVEESERFFSVITQFSRPGEVTCAVSEIPRVPKVV